MSGLELGQHPSQIPYFTDPWSIGETSLDQANQLQSESVFAIGNGFIGIRGCFEEGMDDAARRAQPPIYLNGVHELFQIHYHETAHGFPAASDTRIPVPDGTVVEILGGQERFGINQGEVLDYARRLDLRTGLLTRRVRLKWPSGRIIEATFERIAFFSHPNLVAIRVAILPVNFSGELALRSSLLRFSPEDSERPPQDPREACDPRIAPGLDQDPWLDRERIIVGDAPGFVQVTRNSGMEVSSLMTHDLAPESDSEIIDEPARIFCRWNFSAFRGHRVVVTKYLAYASERNPGEGRSQSRCQAALHAARERGFDALLAEQRDYLTDYWEHAEVELERAPELQTAARFGLFQLMQAAGRDGQTSVSAKGQTGEGYEGHVFWDAESFVLPLFVFTAPEIARSMLRYRYRGLDAARQIASTMGHSRGALYPWRTIGGKECSSYFPAGSAQYHINADIAHAIGLYFEATLDYDFLAQYGAEILVETARLWLEVGYFDPRREGRFCINRVTGPDEYSALVDNNFYTNAMARENLELALEALVILAEQRPEDHLRLVEILAIGEDEMSAWREAAARVYLPYCDQSGIYLQDDSFLNHKRWDFEHTPAEQYPLLLHFHPLALYRHQVCKQADLVLAMLLFGECLDSDAVARSYAYYEELTVHDSTLSPGIFSAVAARIGNQEHAARYFKHAALIDLKNLSGNSDHGLHMAAMASVWTALVQGFGGMRAVGGQLTFDPKFIEMVGPYRFRVRYRGRRIEVAVDRRQAVYRLMRGEPIKISHRGQRLCLETRRAMQL